MNKYRFCLGLRIFVRAFVIVALPTLIKQDLMDLPKVFKFIVTAKAMTQRRRFVN